MTRHATSRVYQDRVATYTYCDHLSDGWYDEIKGFWKTQKVWCCFECCSIIKLKKDQTIKDYTTAANGLV